MLDRNATDFYIAQLIESPDECVKTMVAEVAGKVVGFMSLSGHVDRDAMTSCFYLDPYESLVSGAKIYAWSVC
jgi:hypothetical protein